LLQNRLHFMEFCLGFNLDLDTVLTFRNSKFFGLSINEETSFI
jgi:hypothetical protein